MGYNEAIKTALELVEAFNKLRSSMSDLTKGGIVNGPCSGYTAETFAEIIIPLDTDET